MSIFRKINNFIESNKLAVGLLLFLFSLIFFAWLQYAPVFSDPDSFYHTKMAELIVQNGVIRDFPYLQFTVLKDNYIDHHFLYHVLMVPFVVFLPPAIGAKLFQAVLAALSVVAFYWLMNKLKVKGAIYFTLALFLCAGFLFRISLVKAQPLSLIILFVGSYLIVAKKYWPLFFLSFIYVWTYDGWFLLLIFALLYVFIDGLVKALVESQGSWLTKILKILPVWRPQKIKLFFGSFLKNIFSASNLKLVFAVSGGLLLGIIINPYFPKNLYFYWLHILQIGIVNYQYQIGVGAEWYPYSVFDFFTNTFVSLVFFGLAMILFLNYRRRLPVEVKYFLAIFVLFFLATVKARRNIEYLSPFGIIFAATVFAALSRLEIAQNDFFKFKQALFRFILKDKLAKVFLSSLLVASLAFIFINYSLKDKEFLAKGSNFNYLMKASTFLKDHSQKGDLVFHSDWDDFPALFYHNDKNYYVIGLDPTFMYFYNRDLYWKWVDITKGKRVVEMYSIIKNDFKAKYVLVTTDRNNLISNLDNNFNFKKVYSDDEAVVYEVL
ncbi:MAG: hypothetical protein AAB358_00370 [Patescibacteria group bacterium]